MEIGRQGTKSYRLKLRLQDINLATLANLTLANQKTTEDLFLLVHFVLLLCFRTCF